MYVKRCLALFLSATFTTTVFAAVSVGTDTRAEVDQTFKYSGPNAKAVGVAGEFSNWSELPMVRDGSGTWSGTIRLKPGYYGYKLVVDGEWVLDPAQFRTQGGRWH